MEQVAIKTEFIKLDQLLKFANVADSGALPKLIIKTECYHLTVKRLQEAKKSILVIRLKCVTKMKKDKKYLYLLKLFLNKY